MTPERAGVTRQFTWDGAAIADERAADNTVVRRFFPQGEQIVSGPNAGTTLYYTRDHLGSVREAVDAGGNVRARYDYDPYGVRTPNQTASGSIDTVFGFTGHMYYKYCIATVDTEAAGLDLTWYRQYDPTLGRWLSRDPIGEQGGVNVAAAVSNDPINIVDDSGLAPLSPHIRMLADEVKIASAFGPGGTALSEMNQTALNNAPISTLGKFAFNASRGIESANSARTLATQECRLAATNAAFTAKAGPFGAAGGSLLAAAGTALAIGGLPVAEAVGILGLGTVTGLGVAAAGVGLGIGYGISQIPTGGGENVGTSIGSSVYNAAPRFWNWAVGQ